MTNRDLSKTIKPFDPKKERRLLNEFLRCFQEPEYIGPYDHWG